MKKIFAICVAICLFSNMLLAQSTTTKVIAHRGAWKTEGLPQNSLASLNRAIELGCYGSEFDVHLTKDDVLVVNHDHDFYGLEIEESTYEQLLSKSHPNGEKIPTAEAYIKEGLKQKNTKLIYELKTSRKGKDRTLEAARKSIELVKNLGAKELIEYICFDFDAGELIKTLDSEAEVSYLNGDKTPAEAKKAGYSGIDYHFSLFDKNPEWLGEAQKIGLTVNSWTVNKIEDIKKLIEQRIDFITTDEPELALRELKGE
ncbi:glycerophosphodiester phosphodiesterase [Olivibacter sitiensis]|uniref:glycerophosphodiester phosphodiesterase n=1 Tax=Olivibacter sitiensis TaxID=376470 RepID=UPI00048113BF|nr:glycerophosphodiester phosphodiesterase family protein [Olivibacter sitiensis]